MSSGADDLHTPAPVIAIDGPSGSGKGTIAKRVATALGWSWLDSGALYRIVGLKGERARLGVDDEAGHARLARDLSVRFAVAGNGEDEVWTDGQNLAPLLRGEHVGALASKVAAWPSVREALTETQRAFCRPPGLVADGRDMGSVIFPGARLKIFLCASAAERAERRYKQLKDKGLDVSLADLSRDIEERDRRDTQRAASPLARAEDAIVVDSTGRGIDEVASEVLGYAAERGLVTR